MIGKSIPEVSLRWYAGWTVPYSIIVSCLCHFSFDLLPQDQKLNIILRVWQLSWYKSLLFWILVHLAIFCGHAIIACGDSFTPQKYLSIYSDIKRITVTCLWDNESFLWPSHLNIFKTKDSVKRLDKLALHRGVYPANSILFYPITLEGRRGTTDEFATIPFHLDLFSAALVELAKSILVHSLILSSHLFFCLPLFLFPFTVPCRIVFAKPEDLETWPNHLSFRFLTRARSSSYSPMAAWIFLRTSSLVTWSLYEMFNSLR